jgi:hypothetical protein
MATPQLGPWSAEHFSQANPEGPEQGDVPALLRRVADTLEGYGASRVQDLVLRNHVNDHGTSRRPPIELAPPVPLEEAEWWCSPRTEPYYVLATPLADEQVTPE